MLDWKTGGTIRLRFGSSDSRVVVASSSAFSLCKIARMHLFGILLQTIVHLVPRHGEIQVPLCTSFLFKTKMSLSHRHKVFMS